VEAENPNIGRMAYGAALGAGVLWAGALIAFVMGYEGRTGVDFGPMEMAVLGLLALAPLGCSC
jgi:hypothetical protein